MEPPMIHHEAHVERLVGRRVHDIDGEVVGRIEEIRAEVVDGELVVLEYHIGSAALIERIAGFATSLPFLNVLRHGRRGCLVRWTDMDLSDPARPVVRMSRRELRRAGAG